jgi:putative polymerase
VGLILFWLLLVMNAEERRPEQIRFLHGLCIYLSLTMLVSYSLFSIKTAALLWFIHGSLQMASVPKVASAVRVRREVRGTGIRQGLGLRPT